MLQYSNPVHMVAEFEKNLSLTFLVTMTIEKNSYTHLLNDNDYRKKILSLTFLVTMTIEKNSYTHLLNDNDYRKKILSLTFVVIMFFGKKIFHSPSE